MTIEVDGTEHIIGINSAGVKEFWELKPGNRDEKTSSLWEEVSTRTGMSCLCPGYNGSMVYRLVRLLSSAGGSDVASQKMNVEARWKHSRLALLRQGSIDCLCSSLSTQATAAPKPHTESSFAYVNICTRC